LFPTDGQIDLLNPKSYSYVLGGLKPLSIRFIEILFHERKGFRYMEKKSKSLEFV